MAKRIDAVMQAMQLALLQDEQRRAREAVRRASAELKRAERKLAAASAAAEKAAGRS